MVWSIVWFLVVKNSPSEDPNISEEERLYIENALANDVQKKVYIPVSLAIVVMCTSLRAENSLVSHFQCYMLE